MKATFWLHQPDVVFLLSQLASELGLPTINRPAVVPDATDAMWPESVPGADLRLPLAIGEPAQRGDRAAEPGGVRRVTVTGPWVPDSPFPGTIPARQRLSGSAPLAARGGGELDSHRRAGQSGVRPLRWGRCPEGYLHLLPPFAAATAGHAQVLCGRFVPVAGLTLSHGCAGALCLTCLTGTTAHQQKHQPDEHRPTAPRSADDHGLPTAVRPISDQPALLEGAVVPETNDPEPERLGAPGSRCPRPTRSPWPSRSWHVPDDRDIAVGLPVGTRVRKHRTGRGAREGTVMPYEPEYSRGNFPVRFDDGMWEVLDVSYITVLAPPNGTVR